MFAFSPPIAPAVLSASKEEKRKALLLALRQNQQGYALPSTHPETKTKER